MYQIAKSKSHPPIPKDLSPEAQDFLKKCLKYELKFQVNLKIFVGLIQEKGQILYN